MSVGVTLPPGWDYIEPGTPTWPEVPTPQPQPVVNYDHLRAEYGGVIPISMGTRRMPGQVVWASPVYGTFPDVYVDLGVSYGYNGDTNPEDTEISRIWADGALIWRAGEGILPGLDFLSDNGWKVYNYSGTTTQTANALYVSDVGEENATAFRGQLLSFFRRLPLREFNYQLPGISAEIAGALSESPSDTPSDYAIVRLTYTGLDGSSENFLNTRVILHSDDAGIDGMQASVLNNDDGLPYIAINGFNTSGNLQATETASYYIDMGQLRADFADATYIDVEIRAQWFQYAGGSQSVSWALELWDGTAPTDSGTNFTGNGSHLNTESGSFTVSGGASSVTKTVSLRDTASGGSVIDAPDAITVQAFLERAAEYAGLDPDTDLSFGDGTDDTVAGGLLHEEETFGSLASRVCRYAGWEMFESDTIKFVKPVSGTTYTVDATIPAADLLDQGDRAITTHRRPDSDSPLQMGLSYIDSTQQYKYNTQRARRILYPTRTTQSRRKDSFAVPFVITASEALSRAAQAMFREVAQNVMHTFDLPPEYIYLEPGDILDITAGDTSYEVKIHKIEIAANLAIRCTVVNLMTDEDIELEGSSGEPLDPYRGEPLPIITGTMVAIDGADDFDAGDQINNANFTDGADGFSASGTISTTGTMSGTEGPDAFAATGDSGADASYSSVVFLSYFDGADGATTATEEKGKALTFAGNAQLDTAAKKFGTASLLLDGTGDWVTAVDSGDFTLPGEFTIEMWFRPNGTAGTQGLISHSAGTNPNQNFVLRYEYSSATQKRLTFLFFPTGSGASVVTVQHALEDIDHSVFHHVAVTRDASNNLRLFLDGVLKDTETASGGANVASTLNIGAVGGLLSPLNGWIDSVRITKGVCRYSTGFTPPTTEFPNF